MKSNKALERITYKIAMYAGEDEGNRNMRKEGRKEWNDNDWKIACETFERVYNMAREREVAP